MLCLVEMWCWEPSRGLGCSLAAVSGECQCSVTDGAVSSCAASFQAAVETYWCAILIAVLSSDPIKADYASFCRVSKAVVMCL